MISYSTDMTAPYSEGTVVTYTCNSGYELSTTGDEMRTCMDNGDGSGGSFGGSAPTCQREFLIPNNRDYDNSLTPDIFRPLWQNVKTK